MVMRTNRLLSYLDEAGVHYELIHHRLDYTAQRTAADTHTPGKEFAKPVILEMKRGHVMVVLPAPHKVDFTRAREHFGDEVTLASEETIARLFADCEVGAESALGNLYDLPVYVSPALAKQQYITFNAGTHHEAVRMSYRDYEKLVKPEIVDLSWKP